MLLWKFCGNANFPLSFASISPKSKVSSSSFTLGKNRNFNLFLGAEVLWKHTFSTTFPHLEVTWNYGVLPSVNLQFENLDLGIFNFVKLNLEFLNFIRETFNSTVSSAIYLRNNSMFTKQICTYFFQAVQKYIFTFK